jgi:hypothetical protein
MSTARINLLVICTECFFLEIQLRILYKPEFSKFNNVEWVLEQFIVLNVRWVYSKKVNHRGICP